MSAAAPTADRRPRLNLAPLQKFGRSLMLPIATLPAAGILTRLGSDDMLGVKGLGWVKVATVVGAAGNALFTWLPLLFAVGVAIGMAKKADGSTALAAVVGYMVYKGVSDAMSPLILGEGPKGGKPPLIDFGVLAGIIIGLVSAWLWQRFHRTTLPDYLAFFAGRRLVPILTALAALVIAVLMAFVYSPFNSAITSLGNWVAHNEVVGGFVYGTANRLLIPLGLHHILNNPPWFLIGSYTAGGQTYHGDIARFLHGDPTAGAFMTGFFPVMMFGLPAAAMAIWHEARPEHRKAVGGIMISAALTAFLTGVTEPLEFAFMFVAWPLYIVHALLTGVSLALVNALGIKDGFSFSAGLFDLVFNWNLATKPVLLVVIGLIYAAVYYVLFRLIIRMWNLRTPGREAEGEESAVTADTSA